ncbi:hypothetical protein F5887DRAFT_933960 [Amanita rubescens]|nr:hypothetical protein F5887DRAFT_933960 [Amanita rubescens]
MSRHSLSSTVTTADCDMKGTLFLVCSLTASRYPTVSYRRMTPTTRRMLHAAKWRLATQLVVFALLNIFHSLGSSTPQAGGNFMMAEIALLSSPILPIVTVAARPYIRRIHLPHIHRLVTKQSSTSLIALVHPKRMLEGSAEPQLTGPLQETDGSR